MSSRNREFDIIVWGASGFTGRLVAEYIFQKYNSEDLKWGIAGRDKTKLSSVRDTYLSKNIPILIGDSFDERSLNKITSRTKVICSTVGPYSKYGSAIVKSCLESGTDYCDLAGESQWIRKMIDLYHQEAKSKKLKIVNSCGFDSIPSDMGVYFIFKDILKKDMKISMRVVGAKGGYSGGTYASINNIISEASKNKKIRKDLINPYGLNPEGEKYGPDKRDLNSVIFDKKIKKWIAPFLMAGINTKIVRRSNALSNYRYGKNFQYDEAVMTGDGLMGRLRGILLSIPLIFLAAKPGSMMKGIFKYLSPKPGEGPNKRERETGYFNIRFYVLNESSTSIYKVTGDRDPGYGSTSKMLAESAICLAKDSLNDSYGILTPSIAMDDKILKRLQLNAGLKFSKVN
tara:strand:- start:89 stop:1291 length:1203 start_codon:yes stop_codon:yes gene_type:complete